MIYENLHQKLLDAIEEARKSNLPVVVLALQDAIGCISMMQKDVAVLDLLSKHLHNRQENSRVIGRSYGKVYREDYER